MGSWLCVKRKWFELQRFFNCDRWGFIFIDKTSLTQVQGSLEWNGCVFKLQKALSREQIWTNILKHPRTTTFLFDFKRWFLKARLQQTTWANAFKLREPKKLAKLVVRSTNIITVLPINHLSPTKKGNYINLEPLFPLPESFLPLEKKQWTPKEIYGLDSLHQPSGFLHSQHHHGRCHHQASNHRRHSATAPPWGLGRFLEGLILGNQRTLQRFLMVFACWGGVALFMLTCHVCVEMTRNAYQSRNAWFRWFTGDSHVLLN